MDGMRGVAYGAVRGLSKALVATVFVAGTAAAETLEIVALGDSLTAGYGLPEGDGFVPQLQAWLDAQGIDARVVNAGVSGDTTAGGRARLDWALSDDTDAVIVALGGNDLLRGLPPEVSRENLDAILTEVSVARGLPAMLVGLEAPGNYGPEFKAAFDSIYADLSTQYDAILQASFLSPLVAELNMAEARNRFMQADGIHPNRDGVGVVVRALGPKVAELAARARGE